MKLARFKRDGATHLGLVSGDEMVDLTCAEPGLPHTMEALLAGLSEYKTSIERASRSANMRLPLQSTQLLAPVEEPRHFLAVGLNYRDHASEMGEALPARPRLFVKLWGALAGPRDLVRAPAFSHTLDYEGELACVIGRHCRAVPRSRAHEVIAGFCVVDDFSVREYVNADLLILGKGCAGFAPCGPWLTTTDELHNPHSLSIRTWVNGELRQDSSTREMIFDCYELIEWITRAVALEPGDLITTGSPPGAGAGRRPPRYLEEGDCVRVEIEGLGALENHIGSETGYSFRT